VFTRSPNIRPHNTSATERRTKDTIVTIGELRDMIEGLDDDMEIRIATQPSWPLQMHIDRDVRVVAHVAYIKECGQVYDAPYCPSGVFGDPIDDDEFCRMCARPLDDTVEDPLDVTDPIDCRGCGRDGTPA
jgi:hypothetical protein